MKVSPKMTGRATAGDPLSSVLALVLGLLASGSSTSIGGGLG